MHLLYFDRRNEFVRQRASTLRNSLSLRTAIGKLIFSQITSCSFCWTGTVDIDQAAISGLTDLRCASWRRYLGTF